ncbi:aprataxin and PNK-like factor isoform X2 [Trichomycterus rosablanca]|uniref:aprataxin and PNK-like factor isoform X2 n=1 Tax=Trichomycterus rosablanca TaxID=2290929 RepID=UPI002F353B9D
MPGFELELVDGEGGRTIDLPYGDTVIGRGPYLSVSDKRVSRNHGILENNNGQLRLRSTHVNPCFIQASLEEAPHPLEKDKWHCLKDGSIFSLLPGKYIYKVHSSKTEGTPRNSQGFEDEMEIETQIEQNSKFSRSCEEMLACTQQAKNSLSLTATQTETYMPDPYSSSQVGGDLPSTSKADKPDPLTPQKKRVLPAWMMSVTPVTPNPSVTKATKRVPLQPARNTSSSKRTAGPKRAQGRLEVSLSVDDDDEEGEGVEEECSEVEQMPRKRARRLTSDTEDSQDQASEPKTSQERSVKDKKVDVQEIKKKKDEEREQNRTESTLKSRTGSSASAVESSDNSQEDKKSSENGQQPAMNTKTKVQHRTPCPYGASCYRKNPIHFQECSHPEDDDYEEEQNDNDKDDDQPECPYGTDCYRKNPLHKKEYKHTKPPANKPPPDDNDEEDEDRYEDSFIYDNSEEEEVDEDSEYVPESEDSEKEDIKLLQKEAKAFQKRKK